MHFLLHLLLVLGIEPVSLHKVGLSTELCVHPCPFLCMYMYIHLCVAAHVCIGVHYVYEYGCQMTKLGAIFQAHSAFLFETVSSTGLKLTKYGRLAGQ